MEQVGTAAVAAAAWMKMAFSLSSLSDVDNCVHHANQLHILVCHCSTLAAIKARNRLIYDAERFKDKHFIYS